MSLTITHAKHVTIPDWVQADMDKAAARYFAAFGEQLYPSGATINDIFLSSDVNANHVVTGVLDPANGGTGASSFPVGQIVYGGASNVLTSDSNNYWDAINQRQSINFAAHNQPAALTLSPKISTDAGIVIQGIASQSGDYITMQDSTSSVLTKFTSGGVLTPVQATTALFINDARTFTTVPVGVNTVAFNPSYSQLTGNGSGNGNVIATLNASFSDNRVISATVNGDSMTCLQMVSSRSSTFSTVGRTAGATLEIYNLYNINNLLGDFGNYLFTGGTGHSARMQMVGQKVQITQIQPTINMPGKTMAYFAGGIDTAIGTNALTLTAGTLFMTIAGYRVSANGSTTGTPTYFGFLTTGSGYTKNYGFVNSTAADNFLGTGKTYYGGAITTDSTSITAATGTLSGSYGSIQYNTNLIINAAEAGTGILSILTDISLLDKNLILGTTTGTKIGTATSQKLGFFNATPVVQQTGNLITGLSNLGLITSGTIASGDLPTITSLGQITTYNGISTAGKGLSAIVSYAYIKAQTTAQTVTSYNTPAAEGGYRVGGSVTITAISVDVLNFQVTWTDETGASRTQTFFPMGVTSPSLSTVGATPFTPIDIRTQASSTITIAIVFTTGVGSVTYNAGGIIQQLA